MLAKKIDTQFYESQPKIKKIKKTVIIKKKAIDFPVGLTFSVIIFLFFLIVLVIHQSTVLVSKQYNLCELTGVKETLEQQNLKLTNKVKTLEALERIEGMAKSDFGMSRPDLESTLIVQDDDASVANTPDGKTLR